MVKDIIKYNHLLKGGFDLYRPKIFQVIPATDYKVYVYFDDGKIKLYDASKVIEKGGVFDKIKDINIFVKSCTILNGTLAWDISGKRETANCLDICPDTLYFHCPDVKERDIPFFKSIYVA